MKQSDLVGGTINQIWDEDRDESVMIIQTLEYGLRAITVTDLTLENGDGDDDDEL